ncbi:MAG TPA: hypothetical protein VG106_02195 [Vicinamibacterales bacterium]|nr:hypothetical protein [Vicinamibacterales bacterium]
MRGLMFVALLIGCAGRPACSTTEVFGAEAFYLERAEPEQDFRGTLVFRDVPSTPAGRDHRFFLGDLPVYSGGFTTEPAFRNAAGATVTIRGKLVNFSHGPEIWAARLTSCD